MHPVLFHIGPRPIYWYGVMVALGFLAASAHWSLLARRTGRPPAFGSELAFWIMAAALVGARLVYLAANAGYYLEHPGSIWRLDQGGLVFYGGLAGGVAAVIVLARVRGERLWELGDFAITGVPLGHAIGRLGCFLNGCCFGGPTRCPWGVHFPEGSAPWAAWPGMALHPVQLFEAAAGLLLYALLLVWFLRPRRRAGTVVVAYLLFYPAARFLLEFLRGDERMFVGPWNTAQWFSLLLAAAGLLLWRLLPSPAAAAKDH